MGRNTNAWLFLKGSKVEGCKRIQSEKTFHFTVDFLQKWIKRLKKEGAPGFLHKKIRGPFLVKQSVLRTRRLIPYESVEGDIYITNQR